MNRREVDRIARRVCAISETATDFQRMSDKALDERIDELTAMNYGLTRDELEEIKRRRDRV